jgi:hypothetical protein
MQGEGRGWANAVLAVALAAAALATARHLIAARPRVEGIDFYYYLCVARDLADGVATSETRHFYFPGVYRFWRGVFALFGHSLPGLQTAYVALLVANALAVAALVWRGAARAAPALLAGFWYLALCSSFEGFAGATEPLATLPVLVGLAAWGGEPLAGPRALARALILGACLGLGVYAKQLGGLLAVGAAAMPLMNLAAPRDHRHEWAYLAAIPIAATLVLLIGILAEGEGLAPLRLGLSFASDYPAQGTPRANLQWIASHAPLLAVAATLLVIAAPLALLPRWQPLLRERWAALAGFCLLATVVALVQFSRRDYLHYALLLLPLLIAAVVLVASGLVRRLPERAAVWSEAALVVAALAWLMLGLRAESAPPAPWRAQPDVAADLVALKSLLQAGEDLLIIPPRRNEIHFQLGTRSQSFAPGYTWGPGRGELEAALRKPELDAVLVLRKGLDKTDAATWRLLECDRAVLELGSAGFRPVAKLRASTLFRRAQPPPADRKGQAGAGSAARIVSSNDAISSRRNSSMSGSEVASVSRPT